METVLAVYQRDYHPDFPVVCLDEAMKQLVQEFVEPVAMQPGQPRREDYKSAMAQQICSCSVNR
jgi:hypothetical protein